MRESLASDIPAGDGNIEKLFLRCRAACPLLAFQNLCLKPRRKKCTLTHQYGLIILGDIAGYPGEPPAHGGSANPGGGGGGAGPHPVRPCREVERSRKGNQLSKNVIY
jgi:hypothetical protein